MLWRGGSGEAGADARSGYDGVEAVKMLRCRMIRMARRTSRYQGNGWKQPGDLAWLS